MNDFRFENLEIWHESNEVSQLLLDYADIADSQKSFRFAEQLRGATMSISNNIAEGSGSFSNKDFANYLNIARRSVFECVNILYLFHRRKLITQPEKELAYTQLLQLSKRITAFRKSLLKTG